MNILKPLLFVSCLGGVLVAGCAKQQQFEPVEQICMAAVSKGQAMQAAEEVLGQMNFTIDKADINQGVIITRSLAGSQFFEFWRDDSIGSFNKAEANLHTIRRIIELDMTEQNGQVCISCQAKTQRLSLPERQLTSSSQAAGMFSKSSSSMQRLMLDRDQKADMAWIDLGKDDRLSTAILNEIEKKVTKLQK